MGACATISASLWWGRAPACSGSPRNSSCLLMLSRFLPKDSFGHLMVALGFYRLIGIALGVGGSLVLLFHVSRHPDDRHAEIKLQRFSAWMSALPAAAIAVAAIFAAGPVTSALGKPALGPGCRRWRRSSCSRPCSSSRPAPWRGARASPRRSSGRGRAERGAARAAAAGRGVEPAGRLRRHVMTLSVALPWLWLARRMWDCSVRGLATLVVLGLELLRQVRRLDAVRQSARRRRPRRRRDCCCRRRPWPITPWRRGSRRCSFSFSSLC